ASGSTTVLVNTPSAAAIRWREEREPVFAVAIGIGVNCAAHPDNTGYPAADLAGLGALVVPDALLQELAGAMQKRLAQWKGGLGFSATGASWLKRAAGLGETLRVRLPERE